MSYRQQHAIGIYEMNKIEAQLPHLEREAHIWAKKGMELGMHPSLYQRPNQLMTFPSEWQKCWHAVEEVPVAHALIRAYEGIKEELVKAFFNGTAWRHYPSGIYNSTQGEFTQIQLREEDAQGEWHWSPLVPHTKEVLERALAQHGSRLSLIEGSGVILSRFRDTVHVNAHCAPQNGRIRIHLGIQVPPRTSLRVCNETKPWVEGGAIIFDDSFEHEVPFSFTKLLLKDL